MLQGLCVMDLFCLIGDMLIALAATVQCYAPSRRPYLDEAKWTSGCTRGLVNVFFQTSRCLCPFTYIRTQQSRHGV